MLENPSITFGGLSRFLRLSPSEEQLKKAVEKSKFSELTRQEQEIGFIEKPEAAERFFRVGKANQWREILTKSQIEAVVKKHASMMQRSGYLISDCGADIL